MSDHKTKILKLCEPRIVQDDATELYYYLADPSMGFYTSDDLRIIANKLDELNEGWYQVVDKYLENK